MKVALIICTYQRPIPIVTLLHSVKKQTRQPDRIIIVDGSLDNASELTLQKENFQDVSYYRVNAEQRGLTKQRNYGIDKVNDAIDIVCFLDDDTVLEPMYFEALIDTYKVHPEALGVGGYIINEINWKKVDTSFKPTIHQFLYDGYVRSDGSRFVLRKKLGLDADRQPGFLPTFSHGRSVSFLPPSGKTYQVEQFMGGVASYRLSALRSQRFSEYFEGYGLYEDADFTLRLSKKGALYVNTNAQLHHYHDPDGRPNKFSYGKMVIRNGWYIWRVRYPNPKWIARIKWNATAALLTLIRFTNVLTKNKKIRTEAFTEASGRVAGWFSLLVNKPKIKDE
ncbi:glycosyltransferase family 2 protein [Dokdonia ponticola]|uniref:Glycosyltransferase family 2 protein n=1 Tax=Dokdonia ponticola TaxID=2041041 RepID=A0ABV9I1T6_9FLAO